MAFPRTVLGGLAVLMNETGEQVARQLNEALRAKMPWAIDEGRCCCPRAFVMVEHDEKCKRARKALEAFNSKAVLTAIFPADP